MAYGTSGGVAGNSPEFGQVGAARAKEGEGLLMVASRTFETLCLKKLKKSEVGKASGGGGGRSPCESQTSTKDLEWNKNGNRIELGTPEKFLSRLSWEW